MFFAIVAVFAEFERSIMGERKIDRLGAAGARGCLGGRPAKLDAKPKAKSYKL
jgi:DNA invertase Pin-like site-specific DNA recombinase